MSQSSSIRRPLLILPLLLALCFAHTAHAASGDVALQLPVLYAKSWIVGYCLLFLAILLGMLAVLIPSMRKVLRKKD